MKHVIEIVEDPDHDRVSWACDCGVGGSAPTDFVDEAIEKHLHPEEPVSYRLREE